MGSELCFYTYIKLKDGKGYGSVSIARLCSCILHGLTLVQDSPLIICCWAHFVLSEVSVCSHPFSSDARNYDIGFCGFHQFLQENAEVVTKYKKTSPFYTQ